MAGIPQHVKDAANAADKTIEALNATPAPEATPQAAPIPAAIPLAPPQPAPVTPPLENTVPLPPATALQPPPAPVPPPVAPNAEFETLKHSHDVLKGKYNAELTKANQDNIALREQILQMNQPVTPVAPVVPPAPVVPVRPDLVAMYGQDYVDAIGEESALKVFENQQSMVQVSQQASNQRIADLEALVESGNQGGGQDTAQMFNMMVNQQVPELDALDEDPVFNKWLASPLAAFSPITRKEALQQAYDSHNVGNLSAIVETFKAETAQPDPNAVVVVPLEQQVVPGGNGTVPAAPAPAKTTYSVAQYQEISTNIALGKYTPADKILWQQELNLAQAENRIRY